MIPSPADPIAQRARITAALVAAEADILTPADARLLDGAHDLLRTHQPAWNLDAAEYTQHCHTCAELYPCPPVRALHDLFGDHAPSTATEAGEPLRAAA